MPDKIVKGLQNISLIIGILIGVLGGVQAWAVIPYRLQELEARVRVLEDVSHRIDKELTSIATQQHEMRELLNQMHRIMLSK